MPATLLALGLSLAAAPQGSYFQQDVRYSIDARLNAREHLLTGRSEIRYGNRSPDTLHELVLHLYPNAYRDKYSTAAREQAFYHEETIRRIPARDRGYLEIERVTVDGTPASYRVLDTVLRIELPQPLAPGGEVSFAIEWLEKIRSHVGRSGYRGRHYDMAQWYPKLAVYDQDGWHDEPAHDVGEFYGEFASFDVLLDLPSDYVVAATGMLAEGDAGWDAARERARAAAAGSQTAEPAAGADPRGEPVEVVAPGNRKRVRFRADQVHDFAWVADPAFHLEEGDSGGVPIRVFYRGQSRDDWAGKALPRAVRALGWLQQHVGPYPYPQLTVVEGLLKGGMEHPMLALCGAAREALLVHEIGHIYFYGILANNEIEEAWLDEGFTSWQTRRQMTGRYGPAGLSPEETGTYQRRLRATPARDIAQTRALAAARLGLDEPIGTAAHLFRDKANYRPAVYQKASLFLDMLRFVAGPEEFDRALAAYFREWGLRHVNEARFRQVLERETGRDFSGLFRGWLHSTRLDDLSIGAVRTRPAAEGGYEVEVEVRRGGGLGTPVDVWLRGEDGSERRLRLEGGEGENLLRFQLPSPPAEVVVDPESIAFDPNRLDNRTGLPLGWAPAWPFQRYAPRDAYLITMRPAAWYNDTDGLRAGAVFTGSQEGSLHRLTVAPSVGWKSGRVDFLARYATPIHALGRSEIEAEAHKAEGRLLLEALLRHDLSTRLERLPQTRIEAGFSSFAVRDERWVDPARYDPGTVNQLWLRWLGAYAGPGWRCQSSVAYQFSGQQLSSDYSFNRLSVGLNVQTTRGTAQFKLRGFLGLSSDGDRLPDQERFFLGGGGPMAEFDRPGLRSRDSLLYGLNYHLPGDGNFRAYAAYPVSARRLFTINLETERPLLAAGSHRRFQKLVGVPSVAVFGDMGKAEGTGVDDLSNALFGLGAGLRLRRQVLGKDLYLRLDVPFYANRPGFDRDGSQENRAEPRWLLSIEPAL